MPSLQSFFPVLKSCFRYFQKGAYRSVYIKVCTEVSALVVVRQKIEVFWPVGTASVAKRRAQERKSPGTDAEGKSLRGGEWMESSCNAVFSSFCLLLQTEVGRYQGGLGDHAVHLHLCCMALGKALCFLCSQKSKPAKKFHQPVWRATKWW